MLDVVKPSSVDYEQYQSETRTLQNRRTYRTHMTRISAAAAYPEPNVEFQKWRTGLCDCCAPPGGYALGCRSCCCPCCVYAENVHRMAPKEVCCGGKFYVPCCGVYTFYRFQLEPVPEFFEGCLHQDTFFSHPCLVSHSSRYAELAHDWHFVRGTNCGPAVASGSRTS